MNQKIREKFIKLALDDMKKSKALEEYAARKFRERFILAKRDLIEKFNNHPVTQEIEMGPTAINLSGTLGDEGNLFSFIGFPINSSPTSAVRDFINNDIFVVPKGKIVNNRALICRYAVVIPMEKLYAMTPLPFESGLSWVEGIEVGISGFASYLFGIFPNSRSTYGIETKTPFRSGRFSPTPYMTSLITQFKLML